MEKYERSSHKKNIYILELFCPKNHGQWTPSAFLLTKKEVYFLLLKNQTNTKKNEGIYHMQSVSRKDIG